MYVLARGLDTWQNSTSTVGSTVLTPGKPSLSLHSSSLYPFILSAHSAAVCIWPWSHCDTTHTGQRLPGEYQYNKHRWWLLLCTCRAKCALLSLRTRLFFKPRQNKYFMLPSREANCWFFFFFPGFLYSSVLFSLEVSVLTSYAASCMERRLQEGWTWSHSAPDVWRKEERRRERHTRIS